MKIVLLIGSLLLLICLILLVYLLISPVWLIIDSREGNYWLGWNKWMRAKLSKKAESWGIQIQMPFWTRRYELEKMMFSGRKRLKKSGDKAKTRFNWRKALNIWKVIQIKDLRLILDTRDVVLNAYLFPVFELMRIGTRKIIRINFTGQNEVCLKANVRMINLLKAGYL
jgi:hypothetical protein